MKNIILNGELKDFIKKKLELIYKDKYIPEPIFINYHYWKHGNHFWLPMYNNKQISNYMINPIENIYICGESYSNNQSWIEGCLETCNEVLYKNNEIKNVINKKINNKYIPIEIVKLHNNTKSAWTIYNNKVYDITDFINKHPGGNIIKLAMGNDITELFNSIEHSELSKYLLDKYYIGNVINNKIEN